MKVSREGIFRKRKLMLGAALAALLLVTAIGVGMSQGTSAAGTSTTVSNETSLRNALNLTYDEIYLAPGDYTLTTPLKINRAVKLIGSSGNREGAASATRLIASGDRAVVINEALDNTFGNVALESLTIMNGVAPIDIYGGGGINADTGTSTLSLYNVAVSNNSTSAALGDGGGMYVSGLDGGKLELDRVVVNGNEAADGGGGLYVDGDITVDIVRSTFDGNIAGSKPGGAIDVIPATALKGGPIHIADSAFIANSVTNSNGGGLSINVANTIVENSTFSANAALNGGAIVTSAAGSPAFKQLTLTKNASTLGGALFIAGGDPVLTGSIVSGNTGTANNADIVVGEGVDPLTAATSKNNVVSKALNVFSDTPADGGNVITADAKLAALADNGGYTKTHAPMTDSPALGAGGNGLAYDQRGFPRALTGKASAGAYESWSASVRYGKTYTSNLDFKDATAAISMSLLTQTAGLITNSDLSGTGKDRTVTIVPDPTKYGNATFRFTVTRTIAGQSQNLNGTLYLNVYAAPELTVDMAHSGDFYQGQTNAPYTITVKNEGLAPTTGTVTLTGALRSGLTAVSGSGTGWNCTPGSFSCTSSTAIAAGQSSVITLKVDAADAASYGPLNSTVTVSGGGEDVGDTANNSDTDSTVVQPAPRVTLVSVPANGTYKTGEPLTFKVRYDMTVDVTGTPRLPIILGASTVQAAYSSGSGTNELTFNYTIQNGDLDADGIALDSSLSLNGGTIISGQNVPAKLTLNSIAPTSGVRVDAVAPTITAVAVPATGIYRDGQKLDFVVTYSEAVSVTGNPVLPITIGSQQVEAAFVNKPSASEIKFSYTVASGNNDNNGIELGSALSLEGAVLTDIVGNDAVLTLSTGIDTTGVTVDTKAPVYESLQVPSAGAYKANDKLSFEAEFDENVIVTGTPRIILDVNGVQKYAQYESGTGTDQLMFSYTVQSSDNDANGISFLNEGAIDLNGAMIRDAAGYSINVAPSALPALPSIVLDTVQPVIESAAVAAKTYIYGSTMTVELQLSEPVTIAGGTPKLPMTVAGSTVEAVYAAGSGTDKLSLIYSPGAGIRDTNGIELSAALLAEGASIVDAAGNTIALTIPGTLELSGVNVDTIVPEIDAVTAADDDYKIGETIQFTVTFSDVVIVQTADGTPYLPFKLGSKSLQANYASGSETNKLIFSYTVAAGDADGAAVDLSATAAIAAGGGTIANAGGNNAVLTLNGVDDLSNVIVDSTAPAVASITSNAAGTYAIGNVLEFALNTSESVVVDTTEGSPELLLSIGGQARTAVYAPSASDDNKLVFRYTVAAGEYDAAGVQLQSLNLNDAVITDQVGNSLNAALPALTAQIKVDGIKPAITSVQTPAEGVYRAGQDLTFVFKLNKDVTVNTTGGTSFITLDIGGVTKILPLQAAAPDTFTFTYKILATDMDSAIRFEGFNIGGTAIKDSFGNDLDSALPAFTLPVIKVDTTPPNAPVFTTADGVSHYYDDVVIAGTAEAGSTVTVKENGGLAAATAIANASGVWSVELTDLAEGDYTLKAEAVDAAGNKSAASSLTVKVVPYIALDAANYSLIVGQNKAVKLNATYSDGSVRDVTSEVVFSTDKPAIVTIIGANLNGIKAGKAVLTAQWSGLTVTAPITVLSPSTSGGIGEGDNDSFDLELTIDGIELEQPISLADVEAGHVTLSFNKPSVGIAIGAEAIQKLLEINDKLVIEIRTLSGSIEMPLKQLLAKADGLLGTHASALTADIAPAADSVANAIGTKLSKLNAKLLAGPSEFVLGYEDAKGNEFAFESLDDYIVRSLLAGEAKPGYGSTVLRWDAASGEFSFVPANLVQKDGKWIVQAKDRTNGIYVLVHRSVSFSDTTNHWGKADIELLASMFVVQGKDDSAFDPNGSVTRAEFAALLTRVLGISGDSNGTAGTVFSDALGGWFEDAVRAAVAASIVNGYKDGTFRPNETVSREEMAVMMMRALRFAGVNPAEGANGQVFKDQSEISSWAAEAVNQASHLGLAKGDETGGFRPSDNATRAEAATMLLRLMRQAGLSPW
ncbi:S-layer homology domain-containing protein [Paenibacillus sp. NEAU-GSW1]|uniref:S-layer homology domain-containing protein n=1 Tax=Paenibacillus sp. NEAU-GSW1 TaxID=2682486 RepID=UPI0015630CB4|nr:S-layer homology domain-containing protein [Paenibacillus sp. NEAU-GSW1]